MPVGPEIPAMRAWMGRAGGRGGIRPCGGGRSGKTPRRSGVQAHEAQMAGGSPALPAQRVPSGNSRRALRAFHRHCSVLPLGAGAARSAGAAAARFLEVLE